MMKRVFWGAVLALSCLCGNSLAQEDVPVPLVPSMVRASATLPNQGKNNYDAKNLLDQNDKTIWAAPFTGESIRLEFKVPEGRISSIAIHNGYLRDKKSLINNSRAKKINIYVNDKAHMTNSVTLPDVTDLPECYGCVSAVNVSEDDPTVENVSKVIIEIESIYPGNKWNDLCISGLEYYIW